MVVQRKEGRQVEKKHLVQQQRKRKWGKGKEEKVEKEKMKRTVKLNGQWKLGKWWGVSFVICFWFRTAVQICKTTATLKSTQWQYQTKQQQQLWAQCL